VALFLVLGLPAHKAGLHQSYGVCEFLRGRAILNFNTFGLGLVELAVVTFLEFLLQVKNLVLESELVNLVLSFQGQNLIVGILAETLTIVSIRVEFLDVLNIPTNLTTIGFINALLVVQSLAPRINISPQVLVL
jgi:fumarate reductase subunit C